MGGIHPYYFYFKHQPPDNNFRASTDAWTPSIAASEADTATVTGFHFQD